MSRIAEAFRRFEDFLTVNADRDDVEQALLDFAAHHGLDQEALDELRDRLDDLYPSIQHGPLLVGVLLGVMIAGGEPEPKLSDEDLERLLSG